MKLTNWQLHEPILLAFEDAWATGQVPQLDTFLHPTAEEPHVELLAELVMIDFEHRCQRSMATNLDEYLKRFPRLKFDAEILNELIQHEFRLRRKFGSYPTQAEVDSRFGADSTARQIWHRMSAPNGPQANAAAQLPTGTLVNSYVIEHVVGSGAFATVYSATDTRLNRKVAIKLLTQSADLRPELRLRLQREAQAVASISHPNIVPVFESGTFGEHAYIVTRLIHGETLAQHLRDNSLTTRQSVELVCQLAAALGELHRVGVVHRDIKPANIMLENGIPQLLDFGLAAMTDASQQLTHDGDIVGTPAFMPPEQAGGRAGHSDARSDIYSLGAVMYRLVCGCLPFEGNTSEVISKVLHQEASIPAATTQQVGKDLHTMTLKCLQKNPADRYQTANDLAQDLRRYLNGTPIKARPIGIMTQLGKWCRRRPALATMSAIAIIAVCLLVAVSGQFGDVLQQRDSAQRTSRQTQVQLAASAAETGLLALQRGQVEHAIEYFQQSLKQGHSDRVFVLLKLVESHFIRGDIESALNNWTQAEQEHATNRLTASADTEAERSQLELWKAELALAGCLQLGDGATLFDHARKLILPEPDRLYIEGMLADTSLEAVSLFRQSVQNAPFHHRSRRMLITTQLSLAMLEAANAEIQMARQMYPENTDFILMEGLYNALMLAPEAAQRVLPLADISNDELNNWTSLYGIAGTLITNPAIDTGMGELEEAKLTGVCKVISTTMLPLFRKRHWRLPLKTEARLRNVFRNWLAPKTDGTEQSHGVLIASLESAIQVHPEASLMIVLGGLRLMLCDGNPTNASSEIPQLKLARSAYLQSLEFPGYLKQSDQMTWKALFTIATVLGQIMHHEADKNFQEVLHAASMIQTDSIKVSSRARTFVILTMEHGDNSRAIRWVDRWIELSTMGSQAWQDAVWHKAVLAKRLEQWVDVIHSCDALLDVNPNYPEVVPLRDFAAAKLRDVLGGKQPELP